MAVVQAVAVVAPVVAVVQVAAALAVVTLAKPSLTPTKKPRDTGLFYALFLLPKLHPWHSDTGVGKGFLS